MNICKKCFLILGALIVREIHYRCYPRCATSKSNNRSLPFDFLYKKKEGQAARARLSFPQTDLRERFYLSTFPQIDYTPTAVRSVDGEESGIRNIFADLPHFIFLRLHVIVKATSCAHLYTYT